MSKYAQGIIDSVCPFLQVELNPKVGCHGFGISVCPLSFAHTGENMLMNGHMHLMIYSNGQWIMTVSYKYAPTPKLETGQSPMAFFKKVLRT